MDQTIYPYSSLRKSYDWKAHWGYPPTWVIRVLKVLVLIVPLTILFAALMLVSIKYGDRPIYIAIPEPMDDYVQIKGLCYNLDPVFNVTNYTAVRIFNACEDFRQKETEFYAVKEDKVNPYNYTYVIPGKTICDDRTEVLLIVHAYHDFFDRRKAIRETWGGASLGNKWPKRIINHKIKLAFMFGLHKNSTANAGLLKENELHSDIVQGDFYDSYKNMTLKSLMGLRWAAQYCPSIKYLIKSDDDMIINMPHLLNVLDKTDMRWSIMGPLNVGAKVYRKGSKWSIPKELYPFLHYPPYESGSTYVISSDLIKPLYEAAQYVPPIFIDDVYITGILGRILHVHHKRQEGFAYWVNKAPKACDVISDDIITGTKVKPRLMYRLWKEITEEVKCDT